VSEWVLAGSKEGLNVGPVLLVISGDIGCHRGGQVQVDGVHG
jgi:hypothetical protein